MKTSRRTGRRSRPGCASAAALYLLFAFAGALPGMVFCHRPGGRTALEFARPAGGCPCDACDHCREHRARAGRGGSLEGPVLDACHCVHEPFLSRAESAVLKRDDGGTGQGRTGLCPRAAFSLPGPRQAAAGGSPAVFSPPARPLPSRALRC